MNTHGEWIQRVSEDNRGIWYRGAIVPSESADYAVMAPLELVLDANEWDIFVGAGYSLMPLSFKIEEHAHVT